MVVLIQELIGVVNRSSAHNMEHMCSLYCVNEHSIYQYPRNTLGQRLGVPVDPYTVG